MEKIDVAPDLASARDRIDGVADLRDAEDSRDDAKRNFAGRYPPIPAFGGLAQGHSRRRPPASALYARRRGHRQNNAGIAVLFRAQNPARYRARIHVVPSAVLSSSVTQPWGSQ